MSEEIQYNEVPKATPEEVWAILKETEELFRKSREEREKDREEREAQLRKDREERAKERAKEREEEALRKKEADRTMEELKKQIGKLGNRFGELAEHLVAPNIAEKFNALGYHFEGHSSDTWFKENGRVIAEIDILLENSDFIVAVEVKSKPLTDDVKDHITRLENLRRYKDRHHDSRKIHGAIAGAIMSANVREYAQKLGFYVIEQTGDTVSIDIPENFIPREW